MPVPSTIADLTTSEATNHPADSETITASTRPSDYLRAHAAIIKTLESSVSSAIALKQDADADLTALAGLAKTDGNFIVGNGSTWVVESGATARASLGIAAASESAAGLAELANTSEAEAGSVDNVVMTPLKTAQALGALSLGVGQTWQVQTVGVDRVSGTSYQNSSAAPILVTISGANNSACVVLCDAANPPTTTVSNTPAADFPAVTFVVPPSFYYKVTGATVDSWSELK